MKRTLIPLMLCAAFGLLLVACGGSDSSSNTTTSNTANTTTATSNKGSSANTTSTTSTTNTTASSSGDKLGIPECDEYIAKYEACLNKAPEAQRAQIKSALDQSRAAWRTAASNPQSKAALPGLCKTALDNAKAGLKAAGCE